MAADSRVRAGESVQRINDMSLIIENLPEAIRTTKQQLRAALPEYKEVFREVEAEMRRRVEEIVSERESGHDVIPIIQYKDVAAGGKPPAGIAPGAPRGPPPALGALAQSTRPPAGT